MTKEENEIEQEYIKTLKIHEADGTNSFEELKILELYVRLKESNEVIEKAFEAFKMLPQLNVCGSCNELNKETVQKIYNKIEEAVKLKKEIE